MGQFRVTKAFLNRDVKPVRDPITLEVEVSDYIFASSAAGVMIQNNNPELLKGVCYTQTLLVEEWSDDKQEWIPIERPKFEKKEEKPKKQAKKKNAK